MKPTSDGSVASGMFQQQRLLVVPVGTQSVRMLVTCFSPITFTVPFLAELEVARVLARHFVE